LKQRAVARELPVVVVVRQLKPGLAAQTADAVVGHGGHLHCFHGLLAVARQGEIPASDGCGKAYRLLDVGHFHIGLFFVPESAAAVRRDESHFVPGQDFAIFVWALEVKMAHADFDALIAFVMEKRQNPGHLFSHLIAPGDDLCADFDRLSI